MKPHHLPLSHPRYRPDIDGLRAVAVLSVLVFHAFPGVLPGGFIGVDIFFVISGFLISTILLQNLDSNSFSFSEFYARRARRIFPSLIVVLVSCLGFGWFVLLPDELNQLGTHIAGGSSFISNFVLWSEAGYFDHSASAKPLLHLWSLGIEEQFYVLWPLFLWYARKKNVSAILVMLVLGVLSFYLNLQETTQNPVTAFYSPQTRAWELLAGGILAWFGLNKKTRSASENTAAVGRKAEALAGRYLSYGASTVSEPCAIIGALLLGYGVWTISTKSSFPGTLAAVPVAGTVLLIIAGPAAWINRNLLSHRTAVWFGKISFPLYLWHWPLLSFASIINNETPPPVIRVCALLLSVALAWLTFKAIESPIRHGSQHKRLKTCLVCIALTLCGGLGVIPPFLAAFKSRAIWLAPAFASG